MVVSDEIQTRLVDAAADLVVRSALDGVRRLVSPAELVSSGVSRQTAYRLWPDRGQAVLDVARRVCDVERMMPSFDNAGAAFTSAVQAHARSGRLAVDLDEDERRAIFRGVISVTFEAQLRGLVTPAGWFLQGAALSSSRMWQGDEPDEELAALGRDVLAVRAEMYREATRIWADFLRGAMATFGRRPRTGFSAETIIQLMHCMFDGCLLRMFVDPHLNDPEVDVEEQQRREAEAITRYCDAMFDIAWTYTEPGSVDDPRRPPGDSEDDAVLTFQAMVDAATARYENGEVDVEPASVAGDAAPFVFPTVGDLADSVLRDLLSTVDLEFSKSAVDNPVPTIRAALVRLSEVAESHSTAVAAARGNPPTHPPFAVPFIDELTEAIGGALTSPLVHCPRPAETARSLVGLALAGETGSQAMETILEILQPTPA